MSDEPTKTYTLPGLPVAEITGEQMKGPGVYFNGAFHGNALVSVLTGDKVPVMSYVVAINGRGTLNIPAIEFDSLLAVMARIYLERTGVVQDGDFSALLPDVR